MSATIKESLPEPEQADFSSFFVDIKDTQLQREVKTMVEPDLKKVYTYLKQHPVSDLDFIDYGSDEANSIEGHLYHSINTRIAQQQHMSEETRPMFEEAFASLQCLRNIQLLLSEWEAMTEEGLQMPFLDFAKLQFPEFLSDNSIELIRYLRHIGNERAHLIQKEVARINQKHTK